MTELQRFNYTTQPRDPYTRVQGGYGCVSRAVIFLNPLPLYRMIR